MTKGAILDFIDEYSKANETPISNLCKIFGVLERSFYKHKKKVVKQSNLYLILCKIYEILDERRENKNYGVDRMRIALKQDKDIDVSISTVRRAMKLGELIHKSRRLPNGITKADMKAEKTKNIIKRDFKADEPNKKWLTDITEIACKDGKKLYLCAVFDCYNGEIVGIAIADNMEASLCCNAIKDAFKRTKAGSGVIIHSDAGSQYTSNAYKDILVKFHAIQSMSDVGKCYDNARMESFFATLKKEKIYLINTKGMKIEEVEKSILEYISYYNIHRITTTNSLNLPPTIYRLKMQAEKLA